MPILFRNPILNQCWKNHPRKSHLNQNNHIKNCFSLLLKSLNFRAKTVDFNDDKKTKMQKVSWCDF